VPLLILYTSKVFQATIFILLIKANWKCESWCYSTDRCRYLDTLSLWCQCSQVTAWLRLEQPGTAIPVPLMFTLFECTAYCNVMLGPSIKQLGQLIKQGRLHTKLHCLHCLTATEVWIVWHCCWTEEKMVEAACAVLPTSLAFLFTPTLTGIKLTSG